MKWKFSDGFIAGDFAVSLTKSDSYELAADEKKPFISLVASAASKTFTLGLDDGDVAFVANIGGTNAFTVKNVAGDTGTSVATGKVAIVIASTTADASKVYVLN